MASSIVPASILALTLLTLTALALHPQSRFYPPCPIYQLFHLQCPGCGATRALAALLHGHLHEALRLNALIVMALPVALLYAAQSSRLLLARKTVVWPTLGKAFLYPAIAATLLFTLARNILSVEQAAPGFGFGMPPMDRSLPVLLACGLWFGGAACHAECIAFAQQVHASTQLKADPKTGIMQEVPGLPIKGRRTTIEKPGTYCLTENLWVDGSYQPWRWDGPTFFSDDEVVLELNSDNLVIDLQGHSVGSDARLLAAITTGTEIRALYATERADHATSLKNMTIRNGAVVPKRGNRAVLIAGLEPLENIFSDLQEGYSVPAANASQAAEDDKLNRETWEIQIKGRLLQHSADYPVRNLRLEGLKIKSSMPTVVLQGANSVVRDSVIETDSGTALQIHGPNAVIENNTIIVHCRKSEPRDIDRSQCLSADAPIRLVNADGAVIRHNRIVLLGAAHKRVVSVFQTGAFVFEDNVITGLDDLSQIAKAYSGELNVVQRANQIDNSMAARFKYWF